MPKQITAAEFLAKAIELSGKTQREVAEEVGYSKPNVLSMMKQGQTKIPIERVPALARATNQDPAAFVRLVLREYMPDVFKVIVEHIGDISSEDEVRAMSAYRAARETNPKLKELPERELMTMFVT